MSGYFEGRGDGRYSNIRVMLKREGRLLWELIESRLIESKKFGRLNEVWEWS